MKFRGRVVEGQKLAAQFGVATANLDVPRSPRLREGVWLVRVRNKKNEWNGLLHFGHRVSTDGEFSIEVHLFDESAELYGEILEVETLKFLRETQKFRSNESLFAQIRLDCVQARKFFLRERIGEKWGTVTDEARDHLVNRAVEVVSELPEFLVAKTVFVFAPDAREINFVQKMCAMFSDKKWAFPRVGERGMEFFVSDWDDLCSGKFGILEPSTGELAGEPDLVLVPAVAAAPTGERLGRGGGFYDQFLYTVCASTCCVLPEWAVLSEIPMEPHDVRVDRVISV